jgi:hypothetical protein
MSPQFKNFSVAELCAYAGGDPWKVNEGLQAGNAGAIDDLAEAFRGAGKHVQEADQEFDAAKRSFLTYRHDDGQSPINSSAEVKTVSTALAKHPEELSKIAVDLEQVAASLARAQRDSDGKIGALESELHGIDDQLTDVKNQIADADEDEDTSDLEQKATQLLQQAKDATKGALGDLEEIQGAYTEQLHGAESAMVASGYAPDAIDDVDGVPGNAPQEEAQQYDKSGQRARDQALVDKAKAEGRTHYIANNAGYPGNMTAEEAAAAQRLKDYQAITDPTARFGPGYDQDEASIARRLAGDRLGDYNMANSTGPVPRDPVLGGDARTRAQARLKLQDGLEQGQLPWSQKFMTPDEATQAMNAMEISDRANALSRTQEMLVRCGVSESTAAGIVDDAAHGVVPKVYVDAAAAASKVFSNGGDGIGAFGEGIKDHGSHWTPEAHGINRADVAALAKLGSHVGAVGTVLDLGSAAADLVNGAPVGQVVMKEGGSLAGAWALGQAGAEGGLVVAGPPGAFVGALVLGTAGAFGGEWLGDHGYQWLTE